MSRRLRFNGDPKRSVPDARINFARMEVLSHHKRDPERMIENDRGEKTKDLMKKGGIRIVQGDSCEQSMNPTSWN